MAFVCALVDENDYINADRSGNSWVISTIVGYDDSDDAVYYLIVLMDVIPGGQHELRFCIDVYHGETDRTTTLWSAEDVAKIIGKDDRKKVLAALLKIVQQLVIVVRPIEFVMNTAVGPEKAEAKHVALGTVFEHCGYKVNVFDSYKGRRLWRMKRQDA